MKLYLILKAQLQRCFQKKPDAIFLAHESETFFKAINQFGFKGEIVSANNVFEMIADKQDYRPEMEGVYVVDPEISDTFREKFEARYHLAPVLEAYAGYEALHAMAKAFALDRDHPEIAMKSVSYDGVAGRIDFTGKSCAGNFAKWALYRHLNGKLVKQ